MEQIYQPYFQDCVVLSDETKVHIQRQHPEIYPDFLLEIRQTVSRPDTIRKSHKKDDPAIIFERWFDHILKGKYPIVVVTSRLNRNLDLVTAYPSRRPQKGDIIWTLP